MRSAVHGQDRKARQIGTVVEINRFPVKSMAAEPLEHADVGWHGLAGDRRWAFVRPASEANGFPWLTIRQRPEMALYRPRVVDPSRPDRSPVRVLTPTGCDLELSDPILAREFGAGLRLMKLDRGAFDAMPLSVITTQSVLGLSAEVGWPVDARRFRANLVVHCEAGMAFPEDSWVGASIAIGGLIARVDRRDPRCSVVNVDPVTAHRTPAVLRTIARERQLCLGVYGSVAQPGRVAVGDGVWMTRG